MGSPRLAALLLSLPLLLIGLAVSARVACPCLRSWTSHCLLAYRVVRSCCQDKRFAGRKSSFEPFPVEVWIRDS
ncbi:interleukin 17 receptor E, isoform CRA_b [Mus musculus]|nr:interleukin 17 receptor E, isoform CRA_b [Mus musculus]